MVNIGYTRVSTNTQTVETQIALLKKKDPEMIVFTDIDISGTIPAMNRPGFKKFYDAVKYHKEIGDLTDIYVYDISRLGRDWDDSVKTMIELESFLGDGRGIIVASDMEGSLFNSFYKAELKPMRRLVYGIAAYVAELERKNTAQRTRDRLQSIREQIKKTGYYKTKSGKIIQSLGRSELTIDWDLVDKLRMDGLSYMDIAIRLKINYGSLMTLKSLRKKREEEHVAKK